MQNEHETLLLCCFDPSGSQVVLYYTVNLNWEISLFIDAL